MKRLLALVFLYATAQMPAQSTVIETLGIATAQQAASGLGYNVNQTGYMQDWQFAAIKAAGGSRVRIQCAWGSVEQQSPAPNNSPASPQYVQTPQCAAALASAKNHGLSVTEVAAFGPPNHETMRMQLTTAGNVGDTSLHVVFLSGDGGLTLSNLAYPYDYIADLTNPGPISSKGSYQGDFVTGVTTIDATHATVTLASALTVAIPATDTLQVNRVLYPSAATTSPTDPSVVAYANYVMFLANDMASRGVTGDIELWNEPPWNPDPWDNRCDLYDTSPCPVSPGPANSGTPNYGFVAAVQNKTMPSGVTLTWNGTSGSGASSILAPGMYGNTGVYASQPANVVTAESMHPYGGPPVRPEIGMWSGPGILTSASAATYPANAYATYELDADGGNYAYEAQLDAIAKLANPAAGVGRVVTETNGVSTVSGQRVKQSQFVARQFIGWPALGFKYVDFFQFWDGTHPAADPGFSFADYDGTTVTLLPAAIVLKGLQADMAAIGSTPPQPYSSATLASVPSYSGTYNLATAHFVGALAGATANSELFYLWQRSDCSATNCWFALAEPSAVPATVAVPAGMQVASVKDVVTGLAVSYTVSGQNAALSAVAGNPIEVLLVPILPAHFNGMRTAKMN